MNFNRWIMGLYQEVANELGLQNEWLDRDSRYLRIFDNATSLRVFHGRPNCSDIVSLELAKPPDFYVDSLHAAGIAVNQRHWLRSEAGGKMNLETLTEHLQRYSPGFVESGNRKFSCVVTDETVDEVVKQVGSAGVKRIGIIPLYEHKCLVLLAQGKVVDMVSARPLTVTGDGISSIGELLDRANRHRLETGIPEINHAFSGAKLDFLPNEDQLVLVEDPAFGIMGDSSRIDLSVLSDTDRSCFQRAAELSRLPLQIISAVCGRDGQWKIQSCENLSNISKFILADMNDPTFPLKQCLGEYFTGAGAKYRDGSVFQPPCIGVSQSGLSVDSNLRAIHDAANRMGLRSRLYGDEGRLLRMEKDRKVLEISTRTSPYPRFGCNFSPSVTSSKDVTSRILHKYGLAVPRHRVFSVQNLENSTDKILDYARQNYPVVVKPVNGSSTRGVTTRISSDQQCVLAIQYALKQDTRIMVEEQIAVSDDPTRGGDFRVHVMNGNVVIVLNRIAAYVEGDGSQTIRALVQRYIEKTECSSVEQLSSVTTDPDGMTAEVLNAQGMSFETIPEKGRKVRLLWFMGMFHGGKYEIVDLDRIHPDNLELFSDANTALGLTWSGIDFLSPDISRSYKDVRCAINEVNDKPSIEASVLLDREFPERLLDAYFDTGNFT